MATFTRFEEMDAWKTARLLTKQIYAVSSSGPFARDFGLRDQMRRAAVSIMSNIAEGCDSRTPPQFIEYLGRARASAGELRSQLYIASDLEYVAEQQFRELSDLSDRCARQISRLVTYLEGLTSARVREGGSAVYSTDFDSSLPFNEPTSNQRTSNEA